MKILIVDDNPANIKLLSRFLIKWEYEVIECNSGIDALQLYGEQQPDMVLMDIMMPGLDGKQTTSKLREIANGRHVPIIFVTAIKQEHGLVDALASGGDDYLTKPVDRDILRSKLKAHERIKQLHDELAEKNEKLLSYTRKLEYEHNLVTHFFSRQQACSDLDKSYIRVHSSAASTFNGDIVLVKRRPAGGLYVLIGDFTGHGLSAAMGTLPVTEIFLRLAAANACIEQFAKSINNTLYTLLPREMFLAANLLELLPDGTINTWCGALPEAYLKNSRDHQLSAIHSMHPPLGVVDNSEFEATITTYQRGEHTHLYLYTDGIVEAVNTDGEFFNFERLEKVLSEEEDGIAAVLRKLKEFTANTKQRDDISLVEINLQAISGLGELQNAS